MTSATRAKAISRNVPEPGSTLTQQVPSRRRRRRARSSFKTRDAAAPVAVAPSVEVAAKQAASVRPWTRSSVVPFWKRMLDVTLVLLSLPVTLPLMAAVAVWVRLVSPGPALFRQERVGRKGRRFTLYKFRSMKMNADTGRHFRYFRKLVSTDSPMVKLDLLCDSRLIRGGCFLRSAGLDELPQLFNVLRGEMSLVGPRPCLPEEYRFFSPRQRVRFDVLPGLTGIWQVHGKGVSTFSEMNAMDALYVRLSSFTLDLAIIVRTPFALLRQLRDALAQRHKVEIDSAKAKDSRYMEMPGCGTQRMG